MASPIRIHVVGRKNHGKTTLVADLVREFTERGLRVGTIKHTHHRHELDAPGKDSHRHRTAGAAAVGILSPAMSAVFLPQDPEHRGKEDRYTQISPAFSTCDLVIVEGDSQTDAPKIEVWRAALNTPPIACEDPSILAIVTEDDSHGVSIKNLARSDVAALATWIQAAVLA